MAKAKTALVTGAAGFIGFHLCQRLLEEGWRVVGVDNLSNYYDVRIKKKRLALLKAQRAFTFHKLDIEAYAPLARLIGGAKPDEIIHLAAQAGVRYSLMNPWVYADTNVRGTINVFEAAKRLKLPRVVYASSSSVYGANASGPMKEADRVDQPISVYGASKRADELLAYSYHHLYGIELIGLRFFTVYGPWGRPDLALFKFAKRISAGEPIDVYNRGKMKRSFTHISDVVDGVMGVLKRAPKHRYEIYNLGGAEAVPLLDFVTLIEQALGTRAKKNLMPMQAGDVPETVADCAKAERELGYRARTGIKAGIAEFVAWYKEHERFLSTLKEPKQ